MTIRSLFAAALGAALFACGPGPFYNGGFDDLDEPEGSSVVTGHAHSASGAPAIGVSIFLVFEGRVEAQGATDQTGAFRITADIVGRSALVVNDGQGFGAFREIILYDGDNDAGDLFLEPLEQLAAVMDLSGIGFEERVTVERGDYVRPTYNKDVTAMFAARQLGGEDLYEIVRVALPSGEETVIRSDEDLYNNSRTFALLNDRVLYYRAYRMVYDEQSQMEVRADHHVLIDTETGEELWAAPWWWVRAGPFAAGDAVYVYEGTERRFVYSYIFGSVYEYRMRPVRIDVEAGTVENGPHIGGWWGSISGFVTSDERVAFIPYAECDPEDWECDIGGAQQLQVTELDTLESRYVGNIGGGRLAEHASWDGGDLILHGEGYPTPTLQRFDVSSGAITEIASFSCTDGGCPNRTWISPGGRILTLLYENDEAGMVHSQGLHWVDGNTGAVEPLLRTHVVDGLVFTLCDGDYARCTPTFRGSGVRVSEVFDDDPTDGKDNVAVVDFLSGGDAQARVFEVGEVDWSGPAILDSPDGLTEAVVARDLQTGFLQVSFGQSSGAARDLERKTFITADHYALRFTPDGQRLYYFTRDPISGYQQLFRVERGELGPEQI